MTDQRAFDTAPDATDSAAAASWAVIDAIYAAALTELAAIASAGEQTVAARATAPRTAPESLPVGLLPVPRMAEDDVQDVHPIADLVRVGGLSRPAARHAAADTETFTRLVA